MKIELAAQNFAYNLLEQQHPEILAAIESDIAAGESPARIESIWRRSTGQGQMATIVGLAATRAYHEWTMAQKTRP